MLSRQPRSIGGRLHHTKPSVHIEKGRRKRFVVTFVVLLFLGWAFSGQSVIAQSFNYADFSSTAGLQLNGNAAPTTIFPPIRLQMTDNSAGAGANQTSSVYYNTLVNV